MMTQIEGNRSSTMKHIHIFLMTLFLGLSPLVAQAHGDGGHGVSALTQSEAEEFAEYRVAILVDNGKIEESWRAAKAVSAEKRVYGKKTEWAVSFKNSQATDASKRTLYIFLSIKGKFIAANFTGK